ncbi:MAG: benzoate-CoA ligase family protein, partial [Janthinobacterium lividum]
MTAVLDAGVEAAATVAAPPERFNFATHLFALNAQRAAKLAYIDDVGSISYGELETRARRFASALLELGLRPEERLLLIMLDTSDLPVAFLGALFAGVVPVVVNTLLTSADYAYMLKHSRARAVVASAPLLPTVAQALADARHDCTLIVSRPDDADLPSQRVFEILWREATPLAQAHDAGADDIAFWLYSSGSTGKPKGTVHTHGNLYYTVELYGKGVLNIREDDVVFSAAKLFFAYGLGNGLTFPLSVGATVILMAERPTADAVFARLTKHRPTVFYGVPTLYASMLASENLPARADVAMRICTSAGEALPREIGERYTEHFGCEIIDG